MHHACLVPLEAKTEALREGGTPWDWSYRWLSASVSVLGIEFRSFGRAAGLLTEISGRGYGWVLPSSLVVGQVPLLAPPSASPVDLLLNLLVPWAPPIA